MKPHVMMCALASVTALSTVAASASGQAWVFRNRDYYEPLLAETHAAHVNLLFPAVSDEFQYSVKKGSRMVWNIELGKEIPLFGWESRSAATMHLPARGFAVGFWLPVDFHMIEDLGRDPSNPIIDTDYRFSGMLKAQYALPKRSRVCLRLGDTCRLGLRLQAGHESTHLGDEFSLGARENHATTFERINVSYEYWEPGLSLDIDDYQGGLLTLRGGAIRLIRPSKGWYSSDLAETNGRDVTPSHDSQEWYLGAQYVHEETWESGFATWIFRKPVGWFASLELRERNVYDYHRPSRAVSEDEQMSVNVMLGVRPTRRFLEKGVPDLYLRWYQGVNPFGQFRNQRNYRLYGFGLHVDM